MFMQIRTKALLAPAAIIGSLVLSGCSQYMARTSASQPLNALIEPAEDSRHVATKSTLTFPASVAVIYVPPAGGAFPRTQLRESADLLRQRLLTNSKYIRSASVVSMDDVNGKVSLSHIRAIYDADIAVIVTYEQDQKSQQSGPGGFVDATIVGAFVAPTVKTVTATHVEGKIVHIPNNALMFRQSGKDTRTNHSTSYGRESLVAQESADSLVAATTNLADTLSQTLAKFEEFDAAMAVSMNALMASGTTHNTEKSSGDNWNSVDSFKFSGGGSMDYLAWLLVIPLLLRTRVHRHA